MFSVIVPTYNRVGLLTKTLESLFRQDHPDFEVIVSNDGSSDGTGAYLTILASEGRIRYTEHPNLGLAATRRAGLAIARGEFIAFTDDDCVLPPDWLRNIERHFIDAEVVGVGGATSTGNPGSICALTNDHISNYFKSAVNGRLGRAPYLTGNNVAYRKSALDRAGGPDPRFRMGAEDRDLAFRVQSTGGRIVYDPSIIVEHYNDADLVGYIRHQYRQGKGSRLYYAEAGRGGARPSMLGASAYIGLLASPWRAFPAGTACQVVALILAAQVAVLMGFVAATLAPNRSVP